MRSFPPKRSSQGAALGFNKAPFQGWVVDVGGRQCPFIAHLKELVGFVKKLVGYKKTFDVLTDVTHIASTMSQFVQ